MKTRTALMVSGALAGLVRPLLAQDAKVDLTGPLADVSGASIAMDDGKSVAEAVHALAAPHLAADKTLTVEDVQAAINAVPVTPIAEDALTVAAPAPAPKTPVVKVEPVAALDEAAVQARIDAAVAQAASAASAIRTAERDVEPHIGQVAAMDSAEDYYRMALDSANVKHAGIDSLPALKAMVGMLAKPGETIAQDAAFTETAYDDLFNGATRLVRS
jgi:hypothetical protein